MQTALQSITIRRVTVGRTSLAILSCSVSDVSLHTCVIILSAVQVECKDNKFCFSLAECKSDNDCPYDKTCQNNNCVTPCLLGDIVCGRGAECIAVSHRAQCVCPRGTQGDPRIACISIVCHYNEDCADRSRGLRQIEQSMSTCLRR